ncbi:MAG: chaperone protein htpG [Chlamydiota bacterium]|jgi:molecular chaperone HtpG
MKENRLAIHSENILPIIKQWLYSDRDIFLRELVSNATDAIQKVHILTQAGAATEKLEGRIDVDVDAKEGVIRISDNGIGMTEEEVEKYIAQIAYSGAEEFVQKYKTATDKDPIIGHFGLGFYSSFMVAMRVEIDTLSYVETASPARWVSDGSTTYTLGRGSKETRGTTITLHLSETAKEYLDAAKLKALLLEHCGFMQYPIYLNKAPLGNRAPLWLEKQASECTEQDYLEFHRFLYPMEPDPLFWIHLSVDYPFHLKGILYFPKHTRRPDFREGTIRLYCNRVFVSDNCKNILPEYLTQLKGAIDSPDIPLNVSRSYLQMDGNVRQLSAHIAKKVADRLTQLIKTDRDKFIACWSDIEPILKLGLIQDEKFFDKAQDALLWKNNQGAWTTLTEYLDRAKEKAITYTTQEHATPVTEAYQAKGIEIIVAPHPIDTALITTLEERRSITFRRIDATIADALLDPSREHTLLDGDGKTKASRIASWIQKALSEKVATVEAKSLATDAIPALIVLDESERRFRDYLRLTGNEARAVSQRQFVVNTNSPLIQAIERLADQGKIELATAITEGVYDLALLSQREMAPADVNSALQRQTELLARLVTEKGSSA